MSRLRAKPGLALLPTIFLLPMAALSPGRASDLENGRAMAGRLCATCHMGQGQGEKQGSLGIPSFHAIANRPAQTEAAIVHWLLSKPAMMPDHHLTRDEAHTLAAFIMSLRE